MKKAETNQESQNVSEGAKELRQIEIDFPGIIELVSHHLYRDRSAAVRELLSNANDSLNVRKEEIGFGEEKPVIRLWVDHHRNTARLVVKDNGIGMSKDDLTNYLSTIGASLTKKKRELASSQGQRFDELIGRFGVGFLASFIVAEKIVVETRKPDFPGYRWQSSGDRDYTITEIPNLEPGTTVFLDLKPEVSREWSDDKIKKMVLENARNFAFPIYWGVAGENKLNDLQAPWYSETSPDEEAIERYRSFLATHDDRFASAASALEIIPLHSDDIRGVVYIPNAAAIQYAHPGVVDLYCKRVFVAKDNADMVPAVFNFIKGVVDCFNFRLTASRDEVLQDDYKYQEVRAFVEQKIMNRFRELSERAKEPAGKDEARVAAVKAEIFRLRLQTVMDQYHMLIKIALVQKQNFGGFIYDDPYLIAFESFMPFQSSLHATTTIPEYLDRKKTSARSKEILFLPPNEDYATHRAVSGQEKREFILARNKFEEEYLQRYSRIIGANCVSAVETLKDAFEALTPPTEGWEQIIKYYREQHNHPEFSLSVSLAEFDPKNVFGRLIADQKSDEMKRREEVIKKLEAEHAIDKNDLLYRELELMKQKRPQILFVNKRNPTLSRVAEMLTKQAPVNLDDILHPIFHDIVVMAGHPVHEAHLTDYQNKVYGEILTGIENEQERKNIQVQLNEEKKRPAEALAEAEAKFNEERQHHAKVLAEAETKFNEERQRHAKTLNEVEVKLNEERERLKQIQNKNTELEQKLGEVAPHLISKSKETNKVFFIRPIKVGLDNYDFIAKKTQEICGRLGLDLVNPKDETHPRILFDDIIENLKSSRLIIADVSEINNPNIYYEVGYVNGAFPNKLILIGDQKVIEKLPFYAKVQFVLGYDKSDAEEFEIFTKKFEKVIAAKIRE